MKFYGVDMQGKFKNQELEELPTFNPVTDERRLVYLDDGSLWYGSTDRWILIGGGNTFEVEQEDHGFDALDAIRHNGSEWVLGIANDSEKLATHLVVDVLDADRFRASMTGRHKIASHGLTIGKYYFVSDTLSGGLIDSTQEIYSNPLIYVETEDYIHVLPYRPHTYFTVESGDNTIVIPVSGGGGGGGTPIDTDTFVWRDGSRAWLGPSNFSMGGSWKITNLAAGTSNTDAVRVDQLGDSGLHRHKYLYNSTLTTAVVDAATDANYVDFTKSVRVDRGSGANGIISANGIDSYLYLNTNSSNDFRIFNDGPYTYFQTYSAGAWANPMYIQNTSPYTITLRGQQIINMGAGTGSLHAVNLSQLNAWIESRSSLSQTTWVGSPPTYTATATFYCVKFKGGNCVIHGWIGIKSGVAFYSQTIPNFGQTTLYTVVGQTGTSGLNPLIDYSPKISIASATALTVGNSAGGSTAAIGTYIVIWGKWN